jgi:hypothetical protein
MRKLAFLFASVAVSGLLAQTPPLPGPLFYSDGGLPGVDCARHNSEQNRDGQGAAHGARSTILSHGSLRPYARNRQKLRDARHDHARAVGTSLRELRGRPPDSARHARDARAAGDSDRRQRRPARLRRSVALPEISRARG